MGLSGGGDSMALACLLGRLAEQDGRPFHAVIFDHALRPESAAEAGQASRRAAALGAEVRILRWGEPRKSQQAARLARHRALAETARELGSDRIFLGHTRDDYLETLAMRLARRSRGRSLTSMSMDDASPVWPEGRGQRILRPLLDTPRRVLRHYLQERDVAWVDDPTNLDRRYERVRLRQSGQIEDPVLFAEAEAMARTTGRFETMLSRNAARHLHHSAQMTAWGGIVFDRDLFLSAYSLVRRRGMELAMLAVSGERDLPGPARVRMLLAALRAGASTTAAGAMMETSGTLGRDPGAASGRADGVQAARPLVLGAGETGVFDGRFLVTARYPLRVRAAGRDGPILSDVPSAFRSGTPLVELADGNRLAASACEAAGFGTLRFLGGERVEHLAFPFTALSWFDGQ
ncbi:tRNA lysidine(34) synthetase TilS [Marinicauda sp. Alg238-R41]|uniref:tRNA lysidine(34) synthetase TilS n=1 Tax=Marinicauda sp. Alg238-R41 TaxID=2993447 RepID=UPI0022DF3698|nr:tRNA lysidine(34) synthetase TilS [Marinicauda sp. Alg238-R41]